MADDNRKRDQLEAMLGEALSPVVRLDIPDDLWETNDFCDNPADRLKVTLLVGTYPMHLEAWRVVYDDDQQMLRLPGGGDEDEDLAHLCEAVHADGSFQTTTIRGREYILVASPFC